MTDHAGFTRAFGYLLSGSLIWTTFFFGSYGLAAAICAVNDPPSAFLGIPSTHLGIGLAGILSLLALLLVARQVRTAGAESGHSAGRFGTSLVLWQCGLAAIAIAWNLLPLLFLDGCGLQEAMIP